MGKKKPLLPGTVKVIYNPNAGQKRKLVRGKTYSLEDIQELLERYQIPADYFPTKGPGHATALAAAAAGEGYKTVLVAGGDGTVGEAAMGLLKQKTVLGILPLGSFMNVARMLSLPSDLEMAVAIIKIGRTRKIDVGQVVTLNGEKVTTPMYFLENAGIGLEAELHDKLLKLERGDKKQLWEIVMTLKNYYTRKIEVELDNGEKILERASMVEVSNGPWTGAALKLAPNAKLNDHRFTISVFKMDTWEAVRYLVKLMGTGRASNPKITRYQSTRVKISTKYPRLVHADARIFGGTPAEFRIIPNALHVITGFPAAKAESALKAKTPLDP